MKEQFVFVLAAAVVILVSVANRAKGDFDSFAICTDSSEQSGPAVDGNVVVWSDGRSGNFDIYAYNLTDSNEFTICTADADQSQPAIGGNIVVWRDNRNGNYNIYGYNLNDANEFPICVDTNDQQYPAISGNIVVWRDNRSGNYDIYGYNLSDANEFPICTDSSEQYSPAIDGDIVIWIDVRNGNPNIYGYNLATETEFPICTDSNGQYYPRISGNIVVWADERNGKADIYGIDLTTLPGGNDFPIYTDSAVQSFPVVSGDIVIWEDQRNSNYDIYGYNLSTGTEFEVCIDSCIDSGEQAAPAVDGNTVVWQYNQDIYGAYIPELSAITVLSPNGNDMLLADSNYTITWQSSGLVGEFVKLEYSSQQEPNWIMIDANVANTDTFDWNPLPIIDSNQCLVRVSDKDNPAIVDVSDALFTIFRCDPNLTADMTGDCFVDMGDFAELLAQWLECGNPYDPNWCDNM